MKLGVLNYFLSVWALFGGTLSEKIGIFHWNDISGQVQRFNGSTVDPYPIPCGQPPIAGCVGGLNSLIHYLNTTPFSSPDIQPSKVFRLTSGNLVGGENGWLSIVGWTKYGELVDKYYKPSAMSYGLKEFESGLARTLDYNRAHPDHSMITLSNVACPPVGGGTNENTFCSKVEKVTKLGSTTVGVVGFINPKAAQLTSSGGLQFRDVVTSIRSAITEGKTRGLKTFIAMGDGSLEMAKQIIDGTEVKLVIYGRGFGPPKDMTGAYPMSYNGGWIATAGRYGASLGQLEVTIEDASGRITGVGGKLIPTTETGTIGVPEVGEWSALVDSEGGEGVGSSVFQLQGGERCWRDECNLGNLVADSMVHCAYNHNLTSRINAPIVGIWHAGALFKDTVPRGAQITKLDLHRWLPFHNRAHLVRVKGSSLLRTFDLSAKGIKANEDKEVEDWGQFLQVSSGLEVYYSTRGSPSVEKVRVLSEDLINMPKMMDLVETKDYYVVIPSFIKEGRSVYGPVKDHWLEAVQGVSSDIGFDDDCLEKYIRGQGRVTVGFEERIWMDNEDVECTINSKGKGNTAITVILTIVFMVVILGIIYVGYYYVLPRLTGKRPNGFRNFEENM